MSASKIHIMDPQTLETPTPTIPWKSALEHVSDQQNKHWY
jgi:hypothetical protein